MFVSSSRRKSSLKSEDSLCLITGATGLIGRKLLEGLKRSQPSRTFVALTRQAGRLGANRYRVIELEGNLRLPELGIDPAHWAQVEGRITEVFHCAADIRFDLPLAEAREANVEGTRRVLELSRRCPRLEKLVHVSTTYVAGQSPEVLPEGPFANRHGFFSSYQESKHEAEALVVEAFRDLPAAVFRLSTVIGDSSTGQVEQYNHFHQLLRLVQHNLLPVLPGSSEAEADFVAADWAVAAMQWFFEHQFEAGSIRNFSAGPRDTMRMPEVLREAFDRLGRGQVPELVGQEEFQRYIEKRLARGDLRLRQLLGALQYFLPYFSMRQQFENAGTLERLREAGLARVSSRVLYSRVLDFMKNSREPLRLPNRSVPAYEQVG